MSRVQRRRHYPTARRNWRLSAPLFIVGFGALSVSALALLTAALAGLIWFGGFAGALPSVSELTARSVFQTVPIYANDGSTLLYDVTDPNGGRRTIVPLSAIPRTLIEATIATEDAGFFSNPGFELRSIVRASFDDLTHKEIVSGASTITQQVVRNVLLSPADRTDLSARRKIKEIVIAYQVTQTYTKDDILEIYLNEIYYGNHNYGIEAAAEGYFNESAANLDLAQASLLAGLPAAPGHYDPYARLSDVKSRQEVVLGRMVEQGYITMDQANAADAEDVRLVDGVRPTIAPHFVANVADEVASKIGTARLYQAGDQVITTLDVSLQAVLDRAVQSNLDRVHGGNGTNVAAVALDPTTGAILAMVGSAGYDDSTIAGEVNMALAPRQSGGILTPLTFALALGHGLTLVSPIANPATPSVALPLGAEPTRAPTVQEALGGGLQQSASTMMGLIGNQSFIDLAGALGLDNFAPRVEYGTNAAIAEARVSPLEVAQVYAALANGGVAHRPFAVNRILDRDGHLLDQTTSPDLGAIDPGIGYLVTSVMTDSSLAPVDARPTIDLGTTVAVHAAMSENSRDSWVAGYDPNLVVVVWVGGDGLEPLQNLDPARQIWSDIMRDALKLRPATPFAAPSDVVEVSLCKNAACSTRQPEYVLRGTEKVAADANAVTVARAPRIASDSRTPLVGRDETAIPVSASPTAVAGPSVRLGGKVVVPDVTGATVDQARVRLVAAGLRVVASPSYVSGAAIPGGGNGIAVGQIVSTKPSAGVQVQTGTQITLVVRRD